MLSEIGKRYLGLGMMMNRHLKSLTWCLLPGAFGFWLMTLGLLAGCTQKDPKFQQYLVEGERLYLQHCSNCHQKKGTGLGLVYPPLVSSDYMNDNFEEIVCMMKKGKKGPLMVNGKIYNQPMPGVPTLTELEIAEIVTYIYNKWGSKTGIIDVKSINQSLVSCISSSN